MFYVIYNKSTKFIVTAGIDTSVPQTYSLEARLSDFVSSNKLVAEEHAALTLPNTDVTLPHLGRDMFDATTNTIYPDPNWVEPTPVLAEPTA